MTEKKLFFISLYFCAAVIGASFGWKSLVDPDIGWHLAGGSWMLDATRFIDTDPFAIGSSPWLAYSWIFELAIGLLYRLGDFFALQVTQFVFVLASSLFCPFFVHRAFSHYKIPLSRTSVVSIIALVFLLILQVSPLWHLRPQLLSVLLFALTLLAIINRVPIVALLLMTIIWANLHVYWVFVPVLFFTIRFDEEVVRRGWSFPSLRLLVLTGLLSLSALVSPYGVFYYFELARLLTDHQVAYSLIEEFQRIDLSLGYLTAVYVFEIIVLAYLIVRNRSQGFSPLVLLGVVFAAASFDKRKYLPLFAFYFVFLVANTFSFVVSEVEKRTFGQQKFSRTSGVAVGVLLLVFLSLAASSLTFDPALDEEMQEIRELVDLLPEASASDEVVILNHLNDGGWLALFLYLKNYNLEGDSAYKTFVDGRTLVMGEKRLAEFKSLLQSSEARCEVIARYKPKYFLAPVDSLLYKVTSEPCVEATAIASTTHYSLFRVGHQH